MYKTAFAAVCLCAGQLQQLCKYPQLCAQDRVYSFQPVADRSTASAPGGTHLGFNRALVCAMRLNRFILIIE